MITTGPFVGPNHAFSPFNLILSHVTNVTFFSSHVDFFLYSFYIFMCAVRSRNIRIPWGNLWKHWKSGTYHHTRQRWHTMLRSLTQRASSREPWLVRGCHKARAHKGSTWPTVLMYHESWGKLSSNNSKLELRRNSSSLELSCMIWKCEKPTKPQTHT